MSLADDAYTKGRAWKAHRRACGSCTVGDWCPEGTVLIRELEALVNMALGRISK